MTFQPLLDRSKDDHRVEGGADDGVVQTLLLLAGLGAAAIHFGFAPMHLQESGLHGAFFLTIAWLQVIFALVVMFRPSKAVYVAGAALNAGIIGVWLVSRTAGISGAIEPWGFADAVASGLELVMVLGSIAALAHLLPQRSHRTNTSAVTFGASAVAVAALVSASMVPSLSGHGAKGHSHGGSEAASNETAAPTHTSDTTHSHDTTGSMAGMAGMEHAVAVPYDPNKPIDLGGTAGVTLKQQAEAENIVSATLLGLPQWSDPNVALAAGFRSIGDGVTGTEHFVNAAFMNDDTILDPNKPESLVWDVKDGKRTLAAAMYMVKPGTPLAEVPKMGGKLMQWHIHDNLCYNAEGHVAGLTDAQGNCAPGLVKPQNTPMIHVWIRSNKCGPFAALEGIGAGRIADGEQRLCDSAHGH